MSKPGTFVKVYDNLLDHPAWMDLDPVHVGVWVLALGYCRRNKTYGHIPPKALYRDGATVEQVAELVSAGRLHEVGHACPDCPQPAEGRLFLHAYTEHQSSREQDAELSAKRAEAGRKGGSARANKQLAKRDAEQVGKQNPSPAKQTEAEREREREKTNARAREAAAIAADFDAFWTSYPRKVGKDAAARAYTKARKTVDADTIATGLTNAVQVWRTAGTEPQFIPHASTWLNAGRWADEVPMPGMPAPTRTAALMQCAWADSHKRHQWEDGRNLYHCAGVPA